MSPTLITIYGLTILIFLGFGLFMLMVVRSLVSTDNVPQRIQTLAAIAERGTQPDQAQSRFRFLRLRLRFNTALGILVPKDLRNHLVSANWPIFETEYVLIRLGLTALSFALGWIISQSIFPGIGIGIIAYMVPGIFLRRSINNRRRRFENQLIDVLILINGGVNAGYSLLQALDIVVKEMQPPASEEFHRVRREVGLGLPLGEALDNLAKRMDNDDLDIIVAAININRQVGGNLTVMLSAVTETIRERIRLFSEVRSITSAQRYTGYVLTGLPFIMGAVLFIMNPEYMSRLFEPGWILCIPIGATIGIILGNLVIRRMVVIDI
jgi:tight adherence protein B